ncbi:hypothetical protein AUL39_03385 [Tractidigestivibacter scatoligenes]|uniref:Uncharacterized protein n=1 Tax=Tractidigestivibacter scatoligenes TaxID=1299998 RepID=A0A100YX92_TRASO|nr:hypothetical protein AUL39_03385 [Tractidigestivibacter scatoligenes]
MSLFKCPECGGDISEVACVCPTCGYHSADPSVPIAQQERLAKAETSLASIDLRLRPHVQVSSVDVEAVAREAYGKRGELWNLLSELVANAEALLTDETTWVARITPEMRRRLRSGELEFLVGKDGDTRAILRDAGRKAIRRQVPLDAEKLAPDANQALNNLLMASMMQQVLVQIEGVRQDCARIQGEIRGDRHALGIAAMEALTQANCIRDRRLRRAAIVAAIQKATVARAEHMSSFEGKQRLIAKRHKDMVGNQDFGQLIGTIKSIASGQEGDDAAKAFGDLEDIVDNCYVEVVGWLVLGERGPAVQALSQVQEFIVERRLDKRDTLLMLNSAAREDMSETVNDLAGRFGHIESTVLGLTCRDQNPEQLPSDSDAMDGTQDVADPDSSDGDEVNKRED